jgi:hypothetical protein
MQCSKYKVEPCLMTPDCYSTCSELDCYKGDSEIPFHTLVIPSNMTTENAQSMCIFYSSNFISYAFSIVIILFWY